MSVKEIHKNKLSKDFLSFFFAFHLFQISAARFAMLDYEVSFDLLSDRRDSWLGNVELFTG